LPVCMYVFYSLGTHIFFKKWVQRGAGSYDAESGLFS